MKPRCASPITRSGPASSRAAHHAPAWTALARPTVGLIVWSLSLIPVVAQDFGGSDFAPPSRSSSPSDASEGAYTGRAVGATGRLTVTTMPPSDAAAQIRSILAARGQSARVEANADGSITVVGPPSVQAMALEAATALNRMTPVVPARGGQPVPPRADAEVAISGRFPTQATPRRLERSLANVSAQAIESVITRHWSSVGQSLQRNGSVSRMKLGGEGNDASYLVLDHSAQTAVLTGDPAVIDGWNRVVAALDADRENDLKTRVFHLAQSDPQMVQKAARLVGNSGTAAKTVAFGPAAAATQGPARSGSVAELLGTERAPADTSGAGTSPGRPDRGRLDFVQQDGNFDEPGFAPGGVAPGGFVPGTVVPGTVIPGGVIPGTVVPGMGMGGVTGPGVTGPGTTQMEILNQIGGAMGNVRVELVEGLDVIILTGDPKDVERVARIIEQIESISTQTQPQFEVLPLEHVESAAMEELILSVYNDILSSRQGQVVVRSLGVPNAVLLIGRPDAVTIIKDLVIKLDQPVAPSTQFQVFRLKYASANDMYQRIVAIYPDAGTGDSSNRGVFDARTPRLRAVPDYRSNSLVVAAAPREMEAITALLQTLDTAEGAAQHQVRIVRLQNALATELAQVVQDAVNGQLQGAGAGRQVTGGAGGQQQLPQQQQQAGALGGAGVGGGVSQTSQIHPVQLTLQIVDGQGREEIKSGLLFDVRITADANANALIVNAPAESIELVVALIKTLDRLPDAEAQVKVFRIRNGDAEAIAQALTNLFSTTGTQAGGAGGFGGFGGAGAATSLGPIASLSAAAGETSLLPVRFATELRTNSIIATGSGPALEVVESVLRNLDEDGISPRQTVVYRLHNARADQVALALETYIQSRIDIVTADPRFPSDFTIALQRAIVVPDYTIIEDVLVGSNSLIIAAAPELLNELLEVTEQLDLRRPLVSIQTMIASVQLTEIQEFGIEFGLQDSLLFDRGLSQGIGFNFNQATGPNGLDPGGLATRENLAGQGLVNLGVGRTSAAAGFGGLVLSAGNESISMLLRALENQQRGQILARPMITTLDNKQATVDVGSLVRFPTNVTAQQFGGQTVGTEAVQVGVQLAVVPRVSPDGVIVMEVSVINSSLGPESQGTPIFVGPDGSVLRVPQILNQAAQTTIAARSGQTVVIAGLITKQNTNNSNKVPFLADIPVVGRLFRFDSETDIRQELMIVLTPRLVNDDLDYETLKVVESQRMHWCLEDVVQLHGDVGLSSGFHKPAARPQIIYPDHDPIVRRDGTMPRLFAKRGPNTDAARPGGQPVASIEDDLAAGQRSRSGGAQPQDARYASTALPTHAGNPPSDMMNGYVPSRAAANSAGPGSGGFVNANQGEFVVPGSVAWEDGSGQPTTAPAGYGSGSAAGGYSAHPSATPSAASRPTPPTYRPSGGTGSGNFAAPTPSRPIPIGSTSSPGGSTPNAAVAPGNTQAANSTFPSNGMSARPVTVTDWQAVGAATASNGATGSYFGGMTGEAAYLADRVAEPVVGGTSSSSVRPVSATSPLGSVGGSASGSTSKVQSSTQNGVTTIQAKSGQPASTATPAPATGSNAWSGLPW